MVCCKVFFLVKYWIFDPTSKVAFVDSLLTTNFYFGDMSRREKPNNNTPKADWCFFCFVLFFLFFNIFFYPNSNWRTRVAYCVCMPKTEYTQTSWENFYRYNL